MSDIMKSVLGMNESLIPKEKSISLNSTWDPQNFQKKKNMNKDHLCIDVNTNDKSNEYDSWKTRYRSLVIGDTAEVIAFMESRFKQLQQSVCKIVAKAWIKVIEPKKQTRYPYNRGDRSKPSWWPENIRHKEPDHLMKSERISLLITMLRCSKIPINRLELATAEISTFIPPDKTSLLREIYHVAREEEKMRNGDIVKMGLRLLLLRQNHRSNRIKVIQMKLNRLIIYQSYRNIFVLIVLQMNKIPVYTKNHFSRIHVILSKWRINYIQNQNRLSSEYLAYKKQKIKDTSNHTDAYNIEKDNNVNCQSLDNLSALKKNMNDSYHPMNFSDLKEDNQNCYTNTSMFPLSSDQFFDSPYNFSLLDKNLLMHPKHLLHNYSSSSGSTSNAAISTYLTTDLFSQKNHQQLSEMFSPNQFTSKYCQSYSNINHSCFPLHPDTFYNDGLPGTCFSMPIKTSNFPDSTGTLQIKYGQDNTFKKTDESFVEDTN
uniref:Ydr124wp-like protein n=1 Tax=Pneumocystis carinii TaxID=4754 RepID=Q9HEX8_PNECA|nr:Ydr124wp-like protein [Pneumocystis carinii]